VAFVVGLLAAIAAAGLIWRVEAYRLQEARATAANAASDYAGSIERNIQGALAAANALAALVRQGKGSIPDFEGVAAEMLPLYPGVSELALAPGGIIRSVVPLAGNEKALGLNLLQDPAQSKESILARDSEKLTLAGPVDLVQGGVGLVGRMPVFLRDPGGKHYFWGLTLVVIPVSEMLRAAGVTKLTEQGYVYELWRIRPDLGTRQTIAASAAAALIEPVAHTLQVPNSAWTLSVMPVRGWGDPFGFSLITALGILFSLLLAYLAKLMVEVQVHASALEELVARRTVEVRAREADLTRAQSIARVGSWVLDLAGKELSFSPETYRILGVSRETPLDFEAMLKQTFPDDRDAVDRAWQGVLNGERCDIEYRFMVGAEIRWLRAQAELQFTADGSPWRCAGTVEDISERKRAAEALSANELQLSIIHDNAYEIIIVIGVEPNDQFRFISVNRRFTEATGIAQDQVVGKLVQEVIPEPACALVLGKYKEAIRERRPAHWEEVSDYPAGKKVGEVTIAPIFDAKGNCTQLIGTVHDITERKRADDEIRQLHEALQRHAAELEQRVLERTAELEVAKIRAEAADRVKSTFLATMSHELRTPLNSIIGFTGILLQKLPGPLNAEQEKQLGIVRNASRHLLALINDVLDISKVEAGELHLAPERFDLSALLQRLGAAFAPEAERRGLEFTVDVGEHEASIVGDARRVEQVINNLLTNARKFTPRGSVALTLAREGDFFVIAVADSGVGIKAADMDKLFRPFSQIETGLPGISEGTGLGLAISKHLVEAMGGEIRAKSEPGKGSRFAFTLPAGGNA